MLKQEQHKRFTGMNDEPLSLSCYWYAPSDRSIVPMGNENDNKYQRPDCIHT